jgi:hypothetical protein
MKMNANKPEASVKASVNSDNGRRMVVDLRCGPVVKFKDVNGTPPSLPKGVISDTCDESAEPDDA